MAKLDISFDTFKSQTSDLGTAQKVGSGVFYIKTASHGKIELNVLKGRIIVGSGAPASMLDAIASAVQSKTDLQRGKTNKSYVTFEAGSIDQFRAAFGAVTSVAVPVKAKKVSAPKADRKAKAKLEVAEAAAKINAIRAKNMETIKSVAAKRAAKLVG